MKKLQLFLLPILFAVVCNAQAVFHGTVKIEFEKTVYVRQLYKEMEPEWFERIKDRLPNSTTTYHEFTGDTVRSVYKPGREVAIDPRSFNMNIANQNVVFNDYRNGVTTIQKPVFEETFLIQDSLLKIKWKLTHDTRVIAGYECRKAVGIIDDTLAVFAFYTDEILVKGGPESVHGLPGMILGLGMPRIHTTWFATKVEVNGINMSSIAPATKGKKTTRFTMLQSLEKVLKNWGNYGKSMVLNFLI